MGRRRYRNKRNNPNYGWRGKRKVYRSKWHERDSERRLLRRHGRTSRYVYM